MFGVVVEHFSAIGEELARSEDMLDPELVAKAIEGRPDALKRYASSANGVEYVALGKTDEWDGSSAVDGHGGDDGITDHRRPPPRRVPVAVCPGPERRCGHVEVTCCFCCRVERHHETFVVTAHGSDSGTDERRFRRLHAGASLSCASGNGLAAAR